MDQDIKNRWVEALRSGEYMQGHRQLRGTGSGGKMRYCCLGVLCELAVEAGVIRPANGIYYSGEKDVLPRAVREWAGLGPRSGNPAVTYNDREVSLAELNDGHNLITAAPLDFSQIADIIENQL